MRYLGSHCHLILANVYPYWGQRDETYACKSVENIDVVAGIQIINGAFTINLKSIYGEGGKVRRSGR